MRGVSDIRENVKYIYSSNSTKFRSIRDCFAKVIGPAPMEGETEMPSTNSKILCNIRSKGFVGDFDATPA